MVKGEVANDSMKFKVHHMKLKYRLSEYVGILMTWKSAIAMKDEKVTATISRTMYSM